MTISTSALSRCLLFVPALGCFGPILLVMGLSEPLPSYHVLAYIGALATGIPIAMLGAATVRLLPSKPSTADQTP